MAIDCLKHILELNKYSVDYVIYDPAVNKPRDLIEVFCAKNNIPSFALKKVNSTEALDIVNRYNSSLIFNINSYKIIPDTILHAPKHGIINFHNGPLPLYGGVNIPSWAILNGEQKHGVTWHYIDEGIDTGDIIAQKMFEIPESTTAAGLMVRCINEGITLFQRECENMLTGKLSRIKQVENRKYYYKKDFS